LSRIALLGLTVWLGLTPAASALPPTTDLFGCPLLSATYDAAPKEGWRDTALKGSRVTTSHPVAWRAQQDGSTLTLEAPDGQSWVSIRWSRGGQEHHVDRPTHLTPSCESRSSVWFRDLGRWNTVRLSVTRRAFGMRRRSFALFASYDGGTITAIVTVKWRKKSEDAVTLARELLSRLRVDPADAPSAARAHDAGAPLG
jgi:hypothetical protein